MKKHFLCILATAFIFAVTFTSCEQEENKAIPTFTVRFDSKGGTPTPQEQTVKEGSKINKPADPTRENFNFVGWAKADNETSALWNFETETVTGDIMLFARWAINTYLVTFDSDGGSAVTAQNVAHGSVAIKPADPTRAGYEFDGWFSGDTEWNFATAITAPITLKAKWVAVHTVTFDSDGGSAVTFQTIRNGSKATKPDDPIKAWIAASGLYLGTPPPTANYNFVGWYNGETLWDFDASAVTENITLKAKWTADFNLTRIESIPANDITAAIIYANANSTGVEEYTLLLDANVLSGEQSLNSANVKLTIIGIGAERFITANSTSPIALLSDRLFSIDGNNANLTIGQNITLMGRSGINSNGHIIYVQRGSLIMCNGSKITGHKPGQSGYIGHTVLIEGKNAAFKMEGGEISGNDVSSSYQVVSVCDGGTFDMSGGSIADNNNNNADVFIDDANCTFRLSNTARIGRLMLYANNNTTRSTITIAGNYIGTVTLCLSGYGANASAIATLWTNSPVIINGTASVISMFNNGGLGNFCDYRFPSGGTSIRATHELNASGVLVLK